MNHHASNPRARLLLAALACAACVLPPCAARASESGEPLVLEKSITIPNVPVGPYSDNLAIDAAGGRIFATPQAAKAVAVLDAKDGRVLKMIPVGNPHGLYFSPTLKRLFVVDGASGDLKIIDGDDYSLIKTIPLTKGADGMTYDPLKQLLYIGNGGESAGMSQAIVSVVDTVRMEKAAEIPIASLELEGLAVDSEKQRLYANLDEDDKAVAIVDLNTRQVVGTWKLPPGPHRAKAITLDPEHGRLYVACRDSAMHGTIIVFDLENGQLVATLPIGSWADGLFIDRKRQRIYVSTGLGYIESFAIEPKDVYRRLELVETTILGKTSIYSSELDRLYVDVPHLGGGSLDAAKVLVYKPVP